MTVFMYINACLNKSGIKINTNIYAPSMDRARTAKAGIQKYLQLVLLPLEKVHDAFRE